MKTLFYFFRRYRLASILNLVGLSLSLAAFYLFMTQVDYYGTFNHCLKDYKRTYRLEGRTEFLRGTDWSNHWNSNMQDLCARIPHVESVTSQGTWSDQIEIEVDEKLIPAQFFHVTENFLDFWGNEGLPGSDTWKEQPDGYVMSESLARKVFGNEPAVGKRFSIPKKGVENATVIGVCRDFTDNCTFRNGLFKNYGEYMNRDASNWAAEIYLRLDDERNREAAEKAFFEILSQEWNYSDSTRCPVRLVPMDRAYFEGCAPEDRGNEMLLYAYYTASVFVLLVGLLNFANFSLAQVPVRMRGVNTRKVMGASTASLRLALVMENVIWAIAALVVAALMVLAFRNVPECMELVSGDIGFRSHVGLVGSAVVASVGMGVLSALFSAWYVTSFSPALVLKGTFGLSPRGRFLRRLMLVVQFVTAFVLTIFVLVMAGQSYYIFHSDYGFNKDEVLYARLPGDVMGKKSVVSAEIGKLPFAESCGFAADVPGSADIYMAWGRGDGDHHVTFNALIVEENFLRTLEIPVVEGRDFNVHDRKGAYVVNQAMMQKYPWIRLNQPISADIEEWTGPEGQYPVVGVSADFRLMSMRKDNSEVPVAFIIMGPDMQDWWGDRCNVVFVRVTDGYDKLQAKKKLEQLVTETGTEENCEFRFLNLDLQQMYEAEFRFISQVRLFALVCISITLIGVFCLTMFETEYRRKEIALRKIMGCSVSGIIGLFAGRYLWPLLLGFVIAAPMGYFISVEWLQNFAEHTPVHWWFFPLAFLIVSVVVLLTVVAQSWRVATENPVNNIRTE